MSLAKIYIGIDIGATNVRILAYNKDTGILSMALKKAFVSCSSAEEEIKCNVIGLIASYLNKTNFKKEDVKGIGIAFPGNLDKNLGVVKIWPNNMKWNGFPINSYLNKETGLNVLIEDDATLAAYGEFIFGEFKNIQNLLYITISSGIGCGIIINEEIYNGTNGWAGEIGHTILSDSGNRCSCGQYGCLQTFSSGKSIIQEVKEKLNHSEMDLSNISLKEILQLAKKNSLIAKEIIETAIEYLTQSIYNSILMFDIPHLIFGGGIVWNENYFYELLIDSLHRRNQILNRELFYSRSQLNDLNGIIGAISLIYKRNEGVQLNKNVNWKQINDIEISV
jgi:predicted NBD/HSP70 family sugar kinase